MAKPETKYTKGEEIANTSTHAAGILMGVVIGIIFIVMSVKGGDAWMGWSVGLYLFGMLGSYIASTIYHALPQGTQARSILRKFDHAAFYALHKRRYTHTVFHAFVLLGSICHIVAVWDVIAEALRL